MLSFLLKDGLVMWTMVNFVIELYILLELKQFALIRTEVHKGIVFPKFIVPTPVCDFQKMIHSPNGLLLERIKKSSDYSVV